MSTEVSNMKLIQIMVTNRCSMQCSHCSQMCPHQHNKYDMTLEQVEQALQTLVDYPGHVGCMGGEPSIHPQFSEILALYRKYIPVKARRELWTNGAMYKKYEAEIKDTFYDELVAYNEHEDSQPCWHQPNNIAAEEVFTGWVTGDKVKDAELMWKCIDNCWVQNRWSAMITPHGAYYCEVAAARANVLGGPKGIRVKPGWWKEPLQTYDFLRRDLCTKCGMCLPMDVQPNDKQEHDDVSPKMLRTLTKAGSPFVDRCKPFDVTRIQQFYQCHIFEPETDYIKRGGFVDFPDWHPWVYRPLDEKKHKPEDVKGRTNEEANSTGQNDQSDEKPMVRRGRPPKTESGKDG